MPAAARRVGECYVGLGSKSSMPSIEILCVRPCGTVMVGDLPFPVHVSPDRRSDRGPRPLFQADFNAHRGVLYHLGNPGWRPGTPFFAYELLADTGDGANDEIFELGRAFVPSAQLLLERLIAASQVGRLLFTTDWQFGPQHVVRGGPYSLAEFWSEHDRRRLAINAAYWIYADT